MRKNLDKINMKYQIYFLNIDVYPLITWAAVFLRMRPYDVKNSIPNIICGGNLPSANIKHSFQ